MVRVAILGVAHMHADDYVVSLQKARVDVVGVFDSDELRAQRWGKKHSINVFTDAEDLVASGVDGVIVCSETSRHWELVSIAARAGVAVLCEKPLGATAEQSHQIVDICRHHGVELMTAFPSRFNPTVVHAREVVRSGAIGKIRAFSGTNQSVLPLKNRAWFVDPELAGGGAIMDHVVHLADVYSWFLDQQPESVYAVANRIIAAEVVSVETSANVMVNYPDGVFGSIDCSWSRPLSYPTWGGFAFSIIGDTGTVEVQPMRQRLTQFGGEVPFSWIPWGPDANDLMIREFVNSILEERTPFSSGADGNSATRVALGAISSVRTATTVSLENDDRPPVS
ncbi:MAG: Gfo/Idh/MocA family protein [Rhodoglobus sp.]